MDNPVAPSTKITALANGTYKYELKVIDDRAEWSLDTLLIRVGNGGPTTPPPPDDGNATPIAHAGEDALLHFPVSMFILNGDSSEDPDGQIVTFHWELVSGPTAVTISDADESVASVSNLQEGTYQFRLTVTDNDGKKASDIITVTISADANQPPVAIAGDDQTIMSTDDFFTLNGARSHDDDGKIDAYQWRKISGPDKGVIDNTIAAVTEVHGVQSGTYQFELTVKDDHLAIALDTVSISFERELKDAGVYVYPNPAKNSLNLRLSGTEQGRFSVAVFDVNGRKLYEKNLLKNSYELNEKLPTIQLNSGVYFIQINSNQKIQVTKFVKGR
jgi:hypothetical protein